MNEIFAVAFDISMLCFVVASMVTLGLGLTIAQIIAPFKYVKIVIRALIANFIIVPLFAIGLVSVVPVSEGVKIGIILLSLSGGAPFIPMVVATAKSHVGSGVGLMVLLLVITIFFMPVVVPKVLSGTTINSWDIAKSLVSMMLVPLVLALFVRARFAAVAKRIQPFASIVTSLSVLILVIAVVFLYAEALMSSVSILPIITLFFLGAMTIGYLSGGRRIHARIVLAIGTGLRNPPIAILVASQNFSTEPMAALVPLLVAIIGLSILLPLAIIMGKQFSRKQV